MSDWDGLDKAQTFERGVFLKPGIYDLKIKRCLDKTTRKSGQAFIVEFEVLATNNPSVHQVGQTVSWFQKMADRDVAFGAITEFLAAVCQCDLRVKEDTDRFNATYKPQTPGIMKAAVDEKVNYLKDKPVRVQVSLTKTQKGFDFSKHDYSPYKPGVPIPAAAVAAPVPAAPAAPPALPGLPGIPQ